MKQFWCDLETTGVDPEKHGVWQIAYIIEVDGILKEQGKMETRPFKDINSSTVDQISPEALAIGGITINQLETFESPKNTYKYLISILSKYVDKYDRKDKMFFYGYNGYFDVAFLRKFFEKNGDKYFGSWFWFPPIDIMILAADELTDSRHLMENFKLGTVARKCNIEVDEQKQHDALYDIKLTQSIYKYIKQV